MPGKITGNHRHFRNCVEYQYQEQYATYTFTQPRAFLHCGFGWKRALQPIGDKLIISRERLYRINRTFFKVCYKHLDFKMLKCDMILPQLLCVSSTSPTSNPMSRSTVSNFLTFNSCQYQLQSSIVPNSANSNFVYKHQENFLNLTSQNKNIGIMKLRKKTAFTTLWIPNHFL